MTLPIHESELQAPSLEEFRAIHERLFRSRFPSPIPPSHPPSPSAIASWVKRTRAKYPPVNLPPKRSVAIRRILVEVSMQREVTVAEMIGPSRDISLAHARQEAMYRLASELNMSYVEVGREVGERDHSTVCSGISSYCRRSGIPYPFRPRCGPRR